MESITYKCPNCDGGLEFDPKSQMFKCGYCLSEFTQKELEQQEASGTADLVSMEKTKASETQSKENIDSIEAVVVYSCPSCGAEIITDETTASTFCHYCHNPVVLSGRLEGHYRPDYVVPFEMDKKKAEDIFKGWINKKRYVPKDFYSSKQIELLEGVYYPYWLYSCEMEGKLTANATKINVSRSGSHEYTETSRFQVEREGRIKLEHVSRNALKKSDHRLSEGVLPFDMDRLKPFKGGYLSGFKSERRDLDKEVFEQELKEELCGFARDQLESSIIGYQSVSVSSHNENILSQDWKYALMPVWVLTYKDKKDNKIYYFAMNGQSGKICGVLPIDFMRLAKLFAVVFIPFFILFLIGGYML